MGHPVFVPSTDPRAAQAGFERWRSRPELESGRETCSAVFPVDVDTLFTLCFTNSKFMKEFREERKTFGEQAQQTSDIPPWVLPSITLN